MKLTNLSLAVMVAVGVAACGGSGDDNSNKPADPPKQPTPNQPQQPQQPEAPTNPQQAVDPTGTQVVDDKDLTKQNTVGTLQYIRRDGSQYDRVLNPSKPASASPLLGTTLNEQNPRLTNIVLARQDITRTDGTPVKAQFAGSDNPVPLNPDGSLISDSRVAGGKSLQAENFQNVDILAGMYRRNVENTDESHKDVANNVDDKNKINRVINDKGWWGPIGQNLYEYKKNQEGENNKYPDDKKPYVISYGDVNEKGERVRSNGYYWTTIRDAEIPSRPGVKILQATATAAGLTMDNVGRYENEMTDNPTRGEVLLGGLTAILQPLRWQEAGMDANGNRTGTIHTGKDINGKDVYTYRGMTPPEKSNTEFGKTTITAKMAHTNDVYEGRYNNARYGKGLVWWSAPETAFENSVTRGKTESDDIVNAITTDNGSNNKGVTELTKENGNAATNGLVRIGGGFNTLGQELNYNKETGKWEDHHNTTTRIFGRYHLAYADQGKNPGIKPVTLNSFSGAKSFVAEVENTAWNDGPGAATKDKTPVPGTKPTQYSIGAVPMTLQHVQYGRVTTNLDLNAGEGGYADGFVRNPYAPKNDDGSVDNYFYRGTDATTIEQMASLPSDQKAVYQGHALMYGIDNSYHGSGGRNLPNAFAGTTNGLGLGNFVEARVDFGKKRVLGDVYNEWLLDPSKAATTRDNLVRFQGNIIGNTVIGSADRTYIAGDDCAIFKASFFGEKAEEMGGSFNTVQDTSKYGDAYGQNDWGGVFGASKGSATSNTFQGDDGNNNYGQNNYGQL